MSVSSAAASPHDEECDCLFLPHTHQAATITNCSTIPSNGRQPDRSPELGTRQIPIQHIQHLRMPNTASDGGPPLELHFDPEAKLIAVHKPIPVPLHWQQEVKESLDRDVNLGVLEGVPVGEPVTWCHRMVTARKKNSKPRRTVDKQVLNKHAVCETHHTQSPFHQATLVPAGTKKTITDAWNGYHSVPIREEDRHLSTFITPWGRYRYKTCPQGYAASQDGYTRRFDEIVNDFPNKTNCIDDTCLWADTLEENFFQTRRWLDICGRHGIVQSPDMYLFGSDTVEFAGFVITPTDIQPSDKHIRAIRDFPTPQNITDIRSWFGLINQVSYCDSLRNDMAPFREHLKPSSTFYWDDQLQQVFEQSKAAILDKITDGVRIFDSNCVTCLATDWSKKGIGFWILQKYCICEVITPVCCSTGWKIVFAGSRGSISCGLWTGVRASLRTRLRQLSSSYRPPAATRCPQQPTPRRYQE